jgi:hypothetical protein
MIFMRQRGRRRRGEAGGRIVIEIVCSLQNLKIFTASPFTEEFCQ